MLLRREYIRALLPSTPPFDIFPIHVHNLLPFASLPMLTVKQSPDAFLYLFLLVSAT